MEVYTHFSALPENHLVSIIYAAFSYCVSIAFHPTQNGKAHPRHRRAGLILSI